MIVIDKSYDETCVGLQKSNLEYTYLSWFDGVNNYGYKGQLGNPLEKYEFCFPIGPTNLVEWEE